jgi:hypothetical protein
MPSDFDSNIKELITSQKNFYAMIEEKLLKIDDLARNVDRISLEIDSLKLRSIPPKHDINESLKAMRISIDECKERTARMRAKKDCFVKACSSSFHENNDEDLKVIDVTPIESLFYNINLCKYGTGYESTLARRRPNDSEGENLVEKIDKVGLKRSKL